MITFCLLARYILQVVHCGSDMTLYEFKHAHYGVILLRFYLQKSTNFVFHRNQCKLQILRDNFELA